jgi:hypothetical protein
LCGVCARKTAIDHFCPRQAAEQVSATYNTFFFNKDGLEVEKGLRFVGGIVVGSSFRLGLGRMGVLIQVNVTSLLKSKTIKMHLAIDGLIKK